MYLKAAQTFPGDAVQEMERNVHKKLKLFMLLLSLF